MTYDTAEREALHSPKAVNDIANHALLDLLAISNFPGEAQLRYKPHVHQQLFLIRLLEFAKRAATKL